MPVTALYPDRKEVRCERCGCWHWEGGRCFRDDPKGWPIIQQQRRDEDRRAEAIKAMRDIEAVGTVKGKRRRSG